MKSRCIARNSAAIGKVMTIDAAITAPSSVLNSEENSAQSDGSVFTLLSVAKHSAKMNSFHVVTNEKTTTEMMPGSESGSRIRNRTVSRDARR